MANKSQKVSSRNACGLGIDQWVQVDHRLSQQFFFDDKRHRSDGIVNEREWRNGARRDAQVFHQTVSGSKRQASSVQTGSE